MARRLHRRMIQGLDVYKRQPWTLIEKRLAAAASADMAICLYNPSSKKRRDYLNKACRIVMQSALPETVCGIVKQIGREGESLSLIHI